MKKALRLLSAEISEGQAAKRFRDGHANAYARGFFSGLLGLSVLRTAVHAPDYVKGNACVAAAIHVALFLRGCITAEEKSWMKPFLPKSHSVSPYCKESNMNTITFDCTGLSCPLPVLRLSQAVKSLKNGEQLEMIATDPGSVEDIQAWSHQTGNTVVESKRRNGKYVFVIEKLEGE